MLEALCRHLKTVGSQAVAAWGSPGLRSPRSPRVRGTATAAPEDAWLVEGIDPLLVVSRVASWVRVCGAGGGYYPCQFTALGALVGPSPQALVPWVRAEERFQVFN